MSIFFEKLLFPIYYSFLVHFLQNNFGGYQLIRFLFDISIQFFNSFGVNCQTIVFT